MIRRSIGLDIEQVAGLVREELIDMYGMVSEQDPDDKILKHLRKVIKFYSAPSEWEGFKEKYDE